MENPSPAPTNGRKTAGFEDLVRAARDARHLSENTLLAYQRVWRRLLAWAGVYRLDPLALTREEASHCYSETVAAGGRTATSTQAQTLAALAFAYAYWATPNPFGRFRSPRSAPPAPVFFLQAYDLARLLGHLGDRQATYGGSLTFHLAHTLFFTASRFSEIANLRWSDCLLDPGNRPVALRIRGKGNSHFDLPINAILGDLLTRWRTIHDQYRGMKVFAARGLRFCRSEYMFPGPGGEPYTNRSFNNHLRLACQDLRLPSILTAHGLRHSAAMILLNDQGKKLREVQEVLRHKDIRTTARYSSVASEQRRSSFDALGGGLFRLHRDGPL